MVTRPRRPERSIRCGVPDRDPAHLVVAVRRPVLGPAPEQRQPQPRRVGLDAEVDGRAGQRASLPERRLDVDHADDGGAEHGSRCRREVAQPEDVGARLQRRAGRPRDLVPAGHERHRLAGDDGGADAVAVHDLERGGDRLLGDEIEDRAGPARAAAGADRGEQPPIADERLGGVADAQLAENARRRARSGNPQATEHHGSGQHPSEECPSRQHLPRRHVRETQRPVRPPESRRRIDGIGPETVRRQDAHEPRQLRCGKHQDRVRAV